MHCFQYQTTENKGTNYVFLMPAFVVVYIFRGAPKTLGPASSAIYLVDGWGCNCTKPKYYTTLQLLLYAGCSRVLWTKIEQ